ncbi:uncharacterized protein HaLaN_31444, partial [Haematococcus lacustris]
MARYQDVDCVISNAAYIVAQAFIPFLIKEAQRKQGVDRPSLIMVNSFGGKGRFATGTATYSLGMRVVKLGTTFPDSSQRELGPHM